MTDADVIAEVIAEGIKAGMAPLVTRLTVLEARAPVPGPVGERGEPGAPGHVEDSVVAGLTDRIDSLDAKVVAWVHEPDLSPDDLSAALTDLLRKELAIEPARMQRTIHGPDGAIKYRVVDERAQG